MQTQNRRENHPKQVVDVDKMFVCFLNSKCVIDKHFERSYRFNSNRNQ